MKKTLQIKDAVIFNERGRKIPVSELTDGYVNVAGTVTTTKDQKRIFISTEVLYENGEFFLEGGKKVKITMKTAVPA